MLKDDYIMEELISVIVAVYNVESYIGRCIEGIMRQTYRNLEIVLVDDGSTDDSGVICDRYAKIDERIIVIHQKNQGLSAARNYGIKIGRGHYFSFIDGDDFIEKNFIKQLHRVMSEAKVDLVCCRSIDFLDGDDERVEKYWEKNKNMTVTYQIYSSLEILEKALYQTISITGAPLKLYHKKLFEDIKFPEGKYFEDVATTYKFILKANYVAILSNRPYAYRMRSGSIMNQSFDKKKLDCIWASKQLYDEVKNINISIKAAAECTLFRAARLIFPQIPRHDNCVLEVWNLILKYRNSVLLNDKVQCYERCLALSTLGGKEIFRFALFLFKQIKFLRMQVMLKS